jgi:predicted RND superfamily exporter protein
MLVKPRRPSQDLAFDRKLLDAVKAAERDAREEAGLDPANPGITARYGGNYALALEESELIYRDARFNLLFSLFAVSALYWLCYRRFAALLYSSVPLMVGQALTFAAAALVLGRLNSASSSFSALLMGLGTDFTIVMYARYVEERQRGATLAEATELMVGETGLGVFTGAITSAGTFYAMCLSRFRGLFDLGFLIGTGIMLCGIVIVFLLPAMITWNEGVRKRKQDVVRKLHLQSFGLERLIPFSARHRTPVLVVVGLLTAAALLLARGLAFDDSLNALRSNDTEASHVQREVAQKFEASLSYMMAIARGRTLDEAVARTQQVEERLKPFLADRTIGSYDSVLTYLPPVGQQLQTIELVRSKAGAALDPARVRHSFLAGLEENGFRAEPFEEYLERMQSFLTPERPITLADLEQKGLGQLLDRYIRQEADEVRIVTYLFPTDPKWKRASPPGLAEALSSGDPDIVVTGTNVVGQELRKIFTRDVIRSVVAGLLIVSLLLLVDFRSFRLTGIAMAQLLAGVVLMLGAIRLLGYEINYVNAFVATMILGVGIDYSIHLVHRMHLSGGTVDEGLLETGKAVVMAALTNMAGFGTLMLGNYPALRSFGAVAMVGSITCLITALTLPAAFLGRRS